MGYDISWKNPNSDEEGYFHANIWGMMRLRGAMELAGIFSEKDAKMPEFPDYPQDWTEEDKKAYYDRDEEDTSPIPEKVAAFIKKMEEVRSTPSAEEGCVHWAKFCSNDSWIVTPKESRLIADKLDAMLTKAQNGEKMELKIDEYDGKASIFEVAPGTTIFSFTKEWADYNRKCADANVNYEVY